MPGRPSIFGSVISQASMRPRLGGLGCPAPGCSARSGSPCFNEAEAWGPRMHRGPTSPRSRCRRFNEAAAWGPRMPISAAPPVSRLARFNEAEAWGPRMRPLSKPLEHKAVSPCFRAVVRNGGEAGRTSSVRVFTMPKRPYVSNSMPRFERRRGPVRHAAARKPPASPKRRHTVPLIFAGSVFILQDFVISR